MALETKLGRIQKLVIGHGGYQDCCLGVSVDLGGDGWGVGDFKGAWAPSLMPRSEHARWTEEDRLKGISDAFVWLDGLLKDAKVHDAQQLIGKPVEVTFDGMCLKSWRILTEVL